MPAPWTDEAFAALRIKPGETRLLDPKPAATIGLAAVLIASAAWFIMPPTPPKTTAGPAANSAPARTDPVSARLSQAPRPEVKVVDGAPPAGKPCDEQAWPYIEQRCLTLAPEQAPAVRPQPAPSSPPVARDDQPVGSVTAIAPAAEPAARTAERTPSQKPAERTAPEPARGEPSSDRTVGLAPRETSNSEPAADRPEQRRAGTPAPETRPIAASEGARPMTRREQRRAAREQPRQADAAQTRNTASDPNRIVRRWTEYTYQEPGGRSRRVIVVRRADDPSFRTHSAARDLR